MKSHLLFPRYFRPIGFLLAVPGLVLGFLFLFYHYTLPDFWNQQSPHSITYVLDGYTNELALTLVVVGLMFIAFSKVKNEDELTAHVRLNALYWAILINYIVLLIFGVCVFIIGGVATVNSSIYISLDTDNILAINLIMPLVIFILRFYYLLYKSKEEYYIPSLYFFPYNPFNKSVKILSLFVVVICTLGVIALSIAPVSLDPILWMKYLYYGILISPFILLAVIYSKEQKEDEFISAIRLNAMQVAIYVNYTILLLANFIFYGLIFLSVEVICLSTIPVIFIMVFQYRLYRLSKQNEEKAGSKINLNII